MPIQIELSRIVISEINSQQVIFLREVGGKREFPIIIGIFEATSIDRRVRGFQPQRPLTHDLLCSTIESLGGTLEDIYISRLEEQTFFAALRIRRGEELIEVDARPSDAVAVAISMNPPLPLFIEENVFEQALLANQQ
ncbi:MAG: bifunctional nuclease family protein [Thermoguttaceae bacterium]